MKRALFLLAITGCTPTQTDAWLNWYRFEPIAAIHWAVNECGQLCIDDWDRDGIVEPEPTAELSTTNRGDDTVDGDIFDEPDMVGEQDTSGSWGQCSEWMDDALSAGWTVEQWGTLNWIMAAESNCDPGATSAAGAQGLLQVMPMWADDCGGGSLYDPWFNLACGLHVYHQQGWGAWDVY